MIPACSFITNVNHKIIIRILVLCQDLGVRTIINLMYKRNGERNQEYKNKNKWGKIKTRERKNKSIPFAKIMNYKIRK